MLTYDLGQRGALPLYDYLYRCIKRDILSGRLSAGEKLPSKRALARQLKVAVVTVENAYAQLLAEGYLEARPKRGYYVCPVQVHTSPALPPPGVPAPEPPREHFLLDLRNSAGGEESFPLSVWARLTRQVLSEKGPALLRPIPHNGVPELRAAISAYLYHFRGISAAPEQIVVGAGTEYLYNLIVQLLGRETVFGTEDPGYTRAGRIYALNGARCVPIPIDWQGADVPQAERSGAQVLHLSPSHQFPTGAVLPIGRRQALLNWALRDERRRIVEDDYDSEFRFNGLPIPTLQSIDPGGRVLYVNTFSRTLAPSLRISFLVLPPELLERYRQRLGFYSSTVPAIEQYTLARFLSEGHFEQHINRMRVLYRTGRDRVLQALASSGLSARARLRGEEAGLHFLLCLDTSLPDRELARRALSRGIRLSFLSDYCRTPDPRWAHTLIFRYPSLDPSQLPPALAQLLELLEPGGGTG